MTDQPKPKPKLRRKSVQRPGNGRPKGSPNKGPKKPVSGILSVRCEMGLLSRFNAHCGPHERRAQVEKWIAAEWGS